MEERNQHFAKAAAEYAAKQQSDVKVVHFEPKGHTKPTRFHLEHFCDIEPPTGGEWLIKGIIPKEGVGTLFGNSGSYKSFSTIDIAWHIAAGRPWAGRKVTQADFVYLALEGARGVRKRLSGARLMHGLDGKRPPLYAVGATMNLGTESGDLAKMIEDIEAQGVNPGFVAVDTLSASMGGGDENGPGMAMFIANCQRLAQHFGCFVAAVHHVGHGENAGRRERGHSSLIGNVDTRIFCEKPENLQAALELVKCKDGPDGLKFHLQLEEVVFGRDKDGDPTTTLAVRSAEQVEATPKQAKKVSIPQQERLLIDTVQQALIEAGKHVRPYLDGPDVKAVTEEAIRSRYYLRIGEKPLPDETPEKLTQRQRQAFHRSLNAAVKAMRLIAAERGGERIIWLP